MSSLAVAARNDFGTQMGMPYQGTLGADFFARFVVVVDYSQTNNPALRSRHLYLFRSSQGSSRNFRRNDPDR